MGLIKAALGAAGGVLADQWKEYFYCDALDADVLAVKGEKRTSSRSSNRKGTDNVITSGSVIAVADGQCMMIVEQGKVVELCADPGEFVFDASTEPSLFAGELSQSILDTFASIGKRFQFGGQAPQDQRVYYFNTKELTGNKYGTPSPVPFRVVDQNVGLDVDISIRCFGEYSYRICDPLLFYTNVCGNVTDAYRRDTLDGQLKTELLTALQPAFARISDLGIRYSALPGHTLELAGALNDVLTEKWRKLRGIEIVSVGVQTSVRKAGSNILVGVKDSLDSLGGRDDHKQTDIFHTLPAQVLDGRDGRAAGGQHRVDDQTYTFVYIGRHLAVVLVRLMGLLIAIHTDMTHACRGNKFEQAVDHAQARTKDGNDSDLTARDLLAHSLANRRSYVHIFKREIARCLVSLKRAELLHDLAELL